MGWGATGKWEGNAVNTEGGFRREEEQKERGRLNSAGGIVGGKRGRKISFLLDTPRRKG